MERNESAVALHGIINENIALEGLEIDIVRTRGRSEFNG